MIEKRIKERFGTKANFCAKCGHKPKELATKLGTLRNKLKWLDDFLAPLGLRVTVEDDRDDLIGEERPHFDFSEADKSLHIKNFGTLEPGVKVRVYDTKFSKKPPDDVDRDSYHEGVITGATSLLSTYYSITFAYRVTKAAVGGQEVNPSGVRSFVISRDLSALRYVQIL